MNVYLTVDYSRSLDDVTYARGDLAMTTRLQPAKRKNTNDYLHWAYVLEYTIALTTIDQ